MKALFITGTNQYGVVSHFIQGMRSDLTLLGITTDELDVGSQQAFEQTQSCIDIINNYDLIVSFNAVGLDLRFDGQSLSDYANKKTLLVFLVDHPIHLLDRFIGLNVKVLCVDQEHVAFCQLCNIQGIYFPHAVSASQVEQKGLTQSQEKNQQIIFPASYFDLNRYQEKLKPVWQQISGILSSSNSVTRFMQLLGVLPIAGRPASVPIDDNIRRISMLADLYIRSRLRLDFLKQAALNELQLTVIGRQSQKYQTQFPEHIYEDAIPFKQLVTRMEKAKFVAHNSPGFELGLHERVVMPLSLGTLVVSDVPFIQKSLTAGSIQKLSDAKKLNDAQYQNIANEAHQQIATEHTWKVRWQSLLANL